MDQFQWYEKIGIENKQGLISAKESNEIIRKLMMKSYESEYKVLIMWLPERMNASSANKLLKLIEEPPPFTLFLLVSETPGEIIPTILSRTQMVKIPKMQSEDIRRGLLTRFELSSEIVEDATTLADGNFNRALAFVQPDDTNKQSFERFVAFMRACYGKSITGLMTWVDEISALGRERQKLFLIYGLRMLRENFLMNLGKNEILHMAGYEHEWSIKFSPFINERNIFGLYEEFNNAYKHISANGYARIILTDMGLNVVKLISK
jgi:DNA polymerase III subunit delta'